VANIGSQSTATFGAKTVVQWDGDTMGLLKTLRFRGGYNELKEPVIGSNTQIIGWGYYDGEIEMEGIFSTDDTIYDDLQLNASGVVVAKSLIVQRYDSSGTMKSKVFSVYPRNLEIVDNEDAFVRIRLTGTVLTRPS